MKFAVVDEAGRIKWHGVCADGEHENQAQFGAASVDITDLAGWEDNPEAFQYDHATETMLARDASSESDHVHLMTTLAQHRAGEVNALVLAKVAAGFAYQGHVYQVDEHSKRTMQDVLTELMAGADRPSNGYWRDLVNENVTVTDPELLAFLRAALAHLRALAYAAWGHKAALTKLKTIGEVGSYDINAEWPALDNAAS